MRRTYDTINSSIMQAVKSKKGKEKLAVVKKWKNLEEKSAKKAVERLPKKAKTKTDEQQSKTREKKETLEQTGEKEEIRNEKVILRLEEDVAPVSDRILTPVVGGEVPWKTRYDDGWVKVKSVVDSGAFECVAPPTLAPRVPIQSSLGSRRGQHYISATKNRIPNMGQQTMRATTSEGKRAKLTYQTAEVSRPLTAVGSTCDKGNFVGFYSDFGFIENLSTGDITYFPREEGIYNLELWFREEEIENDPQSFPWPGK